MATLLGLSQAGPEQPTGTIDRAVRSFSRAAILTPATTMIPDRASAAIRGRQSLEAAAVAG